jgi:hypothetical protein
VDLDNGVYNGLLLIRSNGADMLNFVERHLGVGDYIWYWLLASNNGIAEKQLEYFNVAER